MDTVDQNIKDAISVMDEKGRGIEGDVARCLWQRDWNRVRSWLLDALNRYDAALAEARQDVLKRDRLPAWIVWTTNKAGIVTMEAITLDNQRAMQYKRTLEASERDYVIVKIEKTEVNHLLAADMDELWQELYGSVASVQDRVAQMRLKLAGQVRANARREKERLWEIIRSARTKIKELQQEAAAARREIADAAAMICDKKAAHFKGLHNHCGEEWMNAAYLEFHRAADAIRALPERGERER